MASDFETVIAKCDGCKYEEECREMPPCILDAYNKGKADVWADIEKIIDNMSNPIQTMEIIIKQMKEQK